MRFCHDGIEDLRTDILDDMTSGEYDSIGNFPALSEDTFLEILMRVTEHNADEDLADILISQSRDTMRWMRKHKIRFIPMFACQPGEYNPSILDGVATKGLEVPKSNWALPIDTGPFHGYVVTCGITFTFGGLKINNDAQVLDLVDKPIPGLYAAGELVGGQFYQNYPGGTGLLNGSVFGRLAGKNTGLCQTT